MRTQDIMPSDYIVRVKCPHGDRDQLLMLENREESLNQILETPWNFECPVHGVQREIPLEGSEKSLWSSLRSKRKEVETVGKAVPQPRSGKRVSLHVPVLVYGYSKDKTTFQEETTTLLVNASGGLMALNSRVGVGDTIHITNKATRQEQECRVVYATVDVYGKFRVGAAFKRPTPHFWGMNRRETRISKKIRVKVRGMDRSGNIFVQNTCAVDISRHGARLEEIGYLTWPGETIQVKHNFQAASFRVVWTGDIGMPQAGHAGIFNLEPNKNIWGVTIP